MVRVGREHRWWKREFGEKVRDGGGWSRAEDIRGRMFFFFINSQPIAVRTLCLRVDSFAFKA